jgi:hypothetical protein
MGRATVRRVMSCAVIGLLGAALQLAPPASALVVDDTPITAWRTNGPVFAIKVIGDTVIVGGKFTAAISPNNVQVPRQNVAAFSMATGALLPWQADADGVVRALETDGTSLYIGGVFTHVDGELRDRIAKVDLASDTLDESFAPDLNNTVRAISVVDTSVAIGGNFTKINGVRRNHIAKLDATAGAVDTQFTASADKAVWCLVRSPISNVLFAGGEFLTLSGVAQAGMGGVDLTTGADAGFDFGASDTTIGLDISPDGSLIYGALVSNAAVAWNTSNSHRVWTTRTDGNAQAIRYFDGNVYFGFHDGYLGNTNTKALAVNALTGAVDPNWSPTINTFLGVRSIDVTAGGVVLGGNFTLVSGVKARGFAIFHPSD